MKLPVVGSGSCESINSHPGILSSILSSMQLSSGVGENSVKNLNNSLKIVRRRGNDHRSPSTEDHIVPLR